MGSAPQLPGAAKNLLTLHVVPPPSRMTPTTQLLVATHPPHALPVAAPFQTPSKPGTSSHAVRLGFWLPPQLPLPLPTPCEKFDHGERHATLQLPMRRYILTIIQISDSKCSINNKPIKTFFLFYLFYKILFLSY